MIIVCKNCKASFVVPQNTFSAGPRTVRCTKCAHVWTELPPTKPIPTPTPKPPKPPEAPPIPQPLPQTTATGELPQQLPEAATEPMLAKVKRLAAIAALVSFGIILFTVSAFIGGQNYVIKHWPELQPIYMQFGLSEDPLKDNLVLQNITSERRYEDGAMQLVVEGEILSQAEKRQVVPAIQAEAMGPDGGLIESWRIEPPTVTMAPGARVPFKSMVIAPDRTVVEINLSFVEPPHDDK